MAVQKIIIDCQNREESDKNTRILELQSAAQQDVIWLAGWESGFVSLYLPNSIDWLIVHDAGLQITPISE